MAGDNGSKFDPWRIATMVVVVVAFFVGFYLLSGMIDARFDSLEGQLRSTTESLGNDIQANRQMISGQAGAAAPQAVAAEAPAAEGGEEAAEGGEEAAEETE